MSTSGHRERETGPRGCNLAERRPRRERGFTLVEAIVAASVLVLVAMMGVMHVVRTSQHLDWSRDRSFANEKAVSILDELRSFVEGGAGEAAADLDGFDDGISSSPVLTITPDRESPGELVVPDHPVSGNTRYQDVWMWQRRITVRPHGGVESRDLRLVTVRVFRRRPGQEEPGDQYAEVSSVIRTIGDAYPATQVYDVYLLALANAPGWWVHMDAIQPFVEAALTDLESRNRGLSFRTHWITKLGYGRDDEYAPYTNESRASTDKTEWTYVYPGRLPDGEDAMRYYVPGRMRARVNLDGATTPSFSGDYEPTEPFTDANGNGAFDRGEAYEDLDGNDRWDVGNPMPYALADMHNHCMRWPEANARFQARVEAGLDEEAEPTWRLLLDQMIADPDRFHNAILVNLHGELLPMPPARNVSDPAKIPEHRFGWRAVTHPEHLRPRRVRGDDDLSVAPRFRVYAFKTEFLDNEVVTTQPEPYVDSDGNGTWDEGEPYEDWNGNGAYDAGFPISFLIGDGDFTWAPNDGAAPSIRVQKLSGGVDADASGEPDPYDDWADAPCFPEMFGDGNDDGIRQVAEAYLDLDGNGSRGADEPWQEVDGDTRFTSATESLTDLNGNDRYDSAAPAEPFTDGNANDHWDAAEPYWDQDGNGVRTPPSSPLFPWLPWDPSIYGDPIATADYIAAYGEPYLDIDEDEVYDEAEPFMDCNGNGVCDGGADRGEMWFQIAHLTSPDRTLLVLHGTPLETPYRASTKRGLPDDERLYDLDYVPCPTPVSDSSSDRFGWDLYTTHDNTPKNTARWIIELPLDAVRRAFETSGGARDGDATDRLIPVTTRFGTDLTTGVKWPTWNHPQNASVTHAWFYNDPEDIPFSERYQFLGDPRHSPYADTDRRGTTAPNGYNWYFDDFKSGSGSAQSSWPAFHGSRLRDRWNGCGGGHDVARLLSWLRTAIVKTEAVYTTLTGFSYYYLSIGGDVGYDSANGFPNSIPMDGTPFGLTSDVFENSITNGGGTSSIKGSLKYVRSNNGSSNGIRNGGYWWSKPWLGELFQDSAYAAQWKPWGNLRADSGSSAGEYRLVRRGDVPSSQQPTGTDLLNAYSRLGAAGCTSLFNIGTSDRTFHHQYKDGQTGSLVEDGWELAENYEFSMPEEAGISRPFGLSTSGGVGSEFDYTDSYPRFSAQIVRRFYSHQSGQTGSALVRLQEPGANPRGGYIVVTGLDRTLESGSAFIGRYSVLSLLHGFFAAGDPDGVNRIRQLPRIEIKHPTLIHEFHNPAQIAVHWNTQWVRWDGRPYTGSYEGGFSENESEVIYVLHYSIDGGKTWLNMRDDSASDLGEMPWRDGVGPDPARTLRDMVPGDDEMWVWDTPLDKIPAGSYMIRIEAYRASEMLHYAQHMEKFYVDR